MRPLLTVYVTNLDDNSVSVLSMVVAPSITTGSLPGTTVGGGRSSIGYQAISPCRVRSFPVDALDPISTR
jgi:hypothetical protein